MRTLTDFVLREDVQTLIVKLHQALDAIIQKLDADHQVSFPTADIPTVYHNQRMATAFLGCSEKTVYRYRKQGVLPFSYDKQGNIRYAEHDLKKLFRADAWVPERRLHPLTSRNEERIKGQRLIQQERLTLPIEAVEKRDV